MAEISFPSSTPPPFRSSPLGDRPEERDLKTGWKLSLALHLGLATLIIASSIILPSGSNLIIPTLRVDIVGLPDLLKNERTTAPLPGSQEKLPDLKSIHDALEKAEKGAKSAKQIPVAPPAEEALPDEMIKKAVPRSQKQDKKSREKRLQGALARIKSLSRIQEEVTPPSSTQSASNRGALIKGNHVSKGTSLSGDAIESSQASYYDALREHLAANWALPVWLARQNLTAQIQLQIDSMGRILGFKFVRTSGNPQFDQAVKKTLQESQPYPIPPDAIRGQVSTSGVLVGFPL